MKKDTEKDYSEGEKVIYLDRVYDFGYYSATKGKVVIYEEGEKNMQDAIAVNIKEIERAHCKEPTLKEEIINLLDRYKSKVANGYGASTHPKLSAWIIYDENAQREFEDIIQRIKSGEKI